jgi:hypothetical protein
MVREQRNMRIFDAEPRSPVFVHRASRIETAVIGLVPESEFERARAAMPDLAGYFDYDEWLDCREGLQIGLAMAGVDATIVPISFAPFQEWSRLTGARLDERALDAFAALALAMRNASIFRVLAFVSELDFATHCRLVAAFAGRGDYRTWLRHRQAVRGKIEALGGRVEEFPVGVAGFVDWCACRGQNTSEATLDRYAQLMLEHLTSYDPR